MEYKCKGGPRLYFLGDDTHTHTHRETNVQTHNIQLCSTFQPIWLFDLTNTQMWTFCFLSVRVGARYCSCLAVLTHDRVKSHLSSHFLR